MFDSIIFFQFFSVTVLLRFSCSSIEDQFYQWHGLSQSSKVPVRKETETIECCMQFTSLSSITVRETVTLEFLFNKRQCVALGTFTGQPSSRTSG